MDSDLQLFLHVQVKTKLLLQADILDTYFHALDHWAHSQDASAHFWQFWSLQGSYEEMRPWLTFETVVDAFDEKFNSLFGQLKAKAKKQAKLKQGQKLTMVKREARKFKKVLASSYEKDDWCDMVAHIENQAADCLVDINNTIQQLKRMTKVWSFFLGTDDGKTTWKKFPLQLFVVPHWNDVQDMCFKLLKANFEDNLGCDLAFAKILERCVTLLCASQHVKKSDGSTEFVKTEKAIENRALRTSVLRDTLNKLKKDGQATSKGASALRLLSAISTFAYQLEGANTLLSEGPTWGRSEAGRQLQRYREYK